MTTETTADPAREAPGYRVQDFIDAKQLKRDLTFSTNDLTGAMMQQGSMFAHYGILAADAARQVDTVKLLLENTEAAVYKLTRDKFDTEGSKYTEPLLNTYVSRHSRVISMKKALNQAKRVESICKIATEGFRHRRDMLVQQGLISREEMKGETRIAARNARDDAAEGQRTSALERLKSTRS